MGETSPARAMEAKVEVWESTGEVQNLFRTFKGDFLEETFEMGLKVHIGVCQLKKDTCRHAFNTHSLNRYFLGPLKYQPMLRNRSNSDKVLL